MAARASSRRSANSANARQAFRCSSGSCNIDRDWVSNWSALPHSWQASCKPFQPDTGDFHREGWHGEPGYRCAPTIPHRPNRVRPQAHEREPIGVAAQHQGISGWRTICSHAGRSHARASVVFASQRNQALCCVRVATSGISRSVASSSAQARCNWAMCGRQQFCSWAPAHDALRGSG